MIGADTNILVRLIMADVEKQAQKVNEMLNAGTVLYVNEVVVSELFWVLTSIYKFTKNEFIEALDALIDTKNIFFFDNGAIKKALTLYVNSSAGFTDCLIDQINLNQGIETITFDKKASKLKGMKLLK
jgi:predicted nucleic-acid-binding protein